MKLQVKKINWLRSGIRDFNFQVMNPMLIRYILESFLLLFLYFYFDGNVLRSRIFEFALFFPILTGLPF